MSDQGAFQIDMMSSHRGDAILSPPLSPAKLGNCSRTASQDSTADGIRKRVCKACDRCRMKKSKCDGSSPCSRCKADDQICVFGERKKSHDKVYPKGYVEMLEQQQSQMVSGIQELYRLVSNAGAWQSRKLEETDGRVLTHDVLAALGVLGSKHDGNSDEGPFEEDCRKIQSRLIANGARLVHRRRGSASSDSELSQHAPTRTASYTTTSDAKPMIPRDSFAFASTTSSPLTQSPAPRSSQGEYQPPAWPVTTSSCQPTRFASDPQLYAPEWAQALSNANEPSQMSRSKYAMQAPQLEENGNMFSLPWQAPPIPFGLDSDQVAALQARQMMEFGTFANNMLCPSDVDFDMARYIDQEIMAT